MDKIEKTPDWNEASVKPVGAVSVIFLFSKKLKTQRK